MMAATKKPKEKTGDFNTSTNPEAKARQDAAIQKKYGSNSNQLSTGPPQTDIPLLHRDAQNVVNAVTLPNGDHFANIDPEAAQKLVDNWNNQNAEPANSMYADVWQKKQAEAQAAANPNNVTPEQLSQVGKIAQPPGFSNLPEQTIINQAATQDQTGGEILNKLQNRDTVNSNVLHVGVREALKFATGIPIAGKTVNTALQNNEEMRQLISDYSMEDEFSKVKDHVQGAKDLLKQSIVIANQPGDSDVAIQSYNEALLRLGVAEAQLSLIARNDKRAYVDNVKKELVDLELYRRNNVPNFNTKMANALQRPDPKYYDPELGQQPQQAQQQMNPGG
jgi:hypothetical protein